MDVNAALKTASKTNGVPMNLCSDNGQEFMAHDLGGWLAKQRTIASIGFVGEFGTRGLDPAFREARQ
jgi:hypothetical protein